MQGARERVLRDNLKKWRKEMSRMIRELDKVLDLGIEEKERVARNEDLETGKTRENCLTRLSEMKQKIENAINTHTEELVKLSASPLPPASA